MLGSDASGRVARFCDRHFFYDVSDSHEESLQALAAIKFRHSYQVIVLPSISQDRRFH